MSLSISNLQRCKFFLKRKKRNCKMLVSTGEELCAEHQIHSKNTEDGKIRIPCPLDKKHTVYAHKLNKHLKICNAREGPSQSFIKKDINSGKHEEESGISDHHRSLSEFADTDILKVIAKVNIVYNKHIKGKITTKISTHEVVDGQTKSEYGDKTIKHLKQASSILGLLNKYCLLKDNTCFIEFGAGRGQLSYWIAEATQTSNFTKLLLIERASPKHKRDNKLNKSTGKIQRIRADIKDVVLDDIEIMGDANSIVGVTKHLCGEATDLAIRCMINAEKLKDKIRGCLLTFCCHHRCQWTGFVGKEFFQANNLIGQDFEIICGLTSWATCGNTHSREFEQESFDGDTIKRIKLDLARESVGINKSLINSRGNAVINEEYEHDKSTTGYNENEKKSHEKINLSRGEQEEIGRRCKNIINYGRLQFLQKQGFSCFLHYYVDQSVTLENVCIVAKKIE
ncbi:tRNA:m(4)X modification enzyme TRM13 homolog [Cylas formicarius]|uniref:tRNA:m(4)X modification enzyme TRM13 homolog n=1 Tax=Cylas formicarius TaxID=197179 RepID=UPI0029589E4B|nr:tRNA:m(4)X modification enzyme TRM13 homolog [Cylas formicarius]